MAIQITIGGTDYTSVLDFKTVKVQQSREVKGSTLNFKSKIYDDSLPIPRSGAEIVFLDGATREFAGVLTSIEMTMGESNRLVNFACQCNDYSFYLDRRYLNKVYAVQRADLMVQEILDDLQTKSGSLDTHYNDFQAGLLADQAPSIKQQRFERLLPSQALDIIAESVGFYWWIDFDKKVQFREIQNINAPLPVTSGLATLQADSDIVNFQNLSLEESIHGTGTKSIIRGANIKSTATVTDRFIWLTGEDNKFKLGLRPFSFLDITSVRINGGGGLVQKLEHVDYEPTDFITSGEVAIMVGPVNGGTSYVRLRNQGVGDDLTNGDEITVTYNYSIIDDHEAPDILVTKELANRTGGDGVHEFLFSQLSEIQVVDLEQLDILTGIILARKAKIHLIGSFESFTKGWAAGQTFQIKWNKLGIEEQVFVVNLKKQILSPFDDPNTGDNTIISEIEFSNVPRAIRG